MQLSFQVWSVGDLAAYLRGVVEDDEQLADVWVSGEVSNLARPPSGHLYFTLKDSRAALRCVMWRSAVARLAAPPRDGEAVYARGRFTVYEQRGELQLVCEELQSLGAGLLYQQFEALKRKLEREGLFDPARKRPLPAHPRTIGLVTSRKGAVLHDIVHILRRRYPLVRVYLASTLVQGERAPDEICRALTLLQAQPEVELVILARGGGSLEDLWAFNDERVARAICACRVPVISGVGHETDFTIADFCADLRAPTPTAAAQFSVPDQNELRAQLLLQRRRLRQQVRQTLSAAHSRHAQLRRDLVRNSPRGQIERSRQQVDDLVRSVAEGMKQQLALRRAKLDGRVRPLRALDPSATLARGYAIVFEPNSGGVITSAAQVQPGEELRVRVRDGEFSTHVSEQHGQDQDGTPVL